MSDLGAATPWFQHAYPGVRTRDLAWLLMPIIKYLMGVEINPSVSYEFH